MNLKEKIGICYVCSGESYRESVYRKIKNYYQDNDNLYYFILTDNKNYFKDLQRKNLIVNELEDFREEFPKLKDKEFFINAENKSDYAKKFKSQNYLFPFSTYRFSVLQCIKQEIKNIILLCADTKVIFNPDFFNDKLFEKTEMFYNSLSEWDEKISNDDWAGSRLNIVSKILREKYNLFPDDKLRVLDATGRMYIPKDLNSLKKFFNIWNDIIETLYDNGEIEKFKASYVINDELILAPIYNVLNLNKREIHLLQIPIENPDRSIFETKHNSTYERFWTVGVDQSLTPLTDYEEYLKINNLQEDRKSTRLNSSH